MRVESFSTKNNPFTWICGIFKFLHLRKIQTTKRVISCMSLPYISVVDHTIMLNFIENVLCYFESCFSRKAAFRWFSADRLYAPLYREGNYHILVGDGVKQSKEGRRMPGEKKLFQESENSAKPEYIHGHMFGGLAILAGSVQNWACILLSIRLHDGLQAARAWKGTSVHLKELFVSRKEESPNYA